MSNTSTTEGGSFSPTSDSGWLVNFLSIIGWKLLPFFIVLTPFLQYLNAHDTRWNSESALGLGLILFLVAFLLVLAGWLGGSLIEAIITSGLLVIFIDFQSDWLVQFSWLKLVVTFFGIFLIILFLKQNFYKIATTFFLTFFLLTVVQGALMDTDHQSNWQVKAKQLHDRYPSRVIHLVLDGHIGIEGISRNSTIGEISKETISRFYEKYKFRVFGGAYSRYYKTRNSIPHVLNFYNNSNVDSLVEENHGTGLIVSRNDYFTELAGLGYGLNVWQSGMVDYCQHSADFIDGCSTYSLMDYEGLDNVGISLSDRIGLLFRSIAQSSYIINDWLKYQYGKRIMPMANRTGVSLPQWPKVVVGQATWPLNAFNALEKVWIDIIELPTGNFLFAHLMVPHRPYAVNSDCSVKTNIDDWGVHYDSRGEPVKEINDQRYFEQTNCIYVKLEYLFEEMQRKGIFEDSLIIIHGDHGARNSLKQKIRESIEGVTSEDIIDSYSTLFAVKLPGDSGGYDSQVVSIDELLIKIMHRHMKLDMTLITRPTLPFVYLRYSDFEGIDGSNDFFRLSYPDGHLLETGDKPHCQDGSCF